MTSRRKFLQTAASSVGISILPGALFTKTAVAQTVGNMDPASWASASDPTLLANMWANRFTAPVPWALDPTNAVLKTVLNVDRYGNVPVLNKTLKSNLPAIGFVWSPDPGTNNTYSIKAGATVWPMTGKLGTKFPDGSNVPVTKVWGYGNYETASIFTDGTGLPVTMPGRTFVVQRGTPIYVNWYNNLVDGAGKPLAHILPVDQTIAMQTTPSGAGINGVPITIHHHGAASAFEFDGGPDQWFTPLRKQVGPGVYIGGANPNSTSGSDHLTYRYDNTEEACMHWYHDHAEGLTAINAFAGLAGLYIIRDNNEATLIKNALIPTGEQEVPLVIQDKLFQPTGNMAFGDDSPAFNGWNTQTPLQYLPGFGTNYNPNDPNTVVTGTQPARGPEMFGDVICVNGVVWPRLDVEPRQYRLRLLNASDSRVYNLNFGGLTIYQITTDGGFLNAPVAMSTIVIAPGERKDIVVDFTGKGGSNFVVTNDANFPYPGGDPTTSGDPFGNIMQINVSKKLNTSVNPVSKMTPTTPLRGYDRATPPLPSVTSVPTRGIAATRQIMLGEGCDQYGRVMPMLGTLAEGTKTFHDPVDITVTAGTTEVWEFWNTTADAHPIHMHLVQFRAINRQPFNAGVIEKLLPNGWDGVQIDPAAPATLNAGPAQPAPADEQGWKDTIVCPPGYVTRVVATFPRKGKYVYHCHILSHEEHDMMRWYQVI